jgi:hypothetical protein
MRLTDEEAVDLEARASRDGIAKADVNRKAMGWEVVGLVKPPAPEANGSAPPPPVSPSATEQPGVAAAGELARRIADRRKR